MRSLSIGLAVMGLALSSCASRERVAGGVHIDLQVRTYDDEVRVRWTIRNLEPETIVVPMPEHRQYRREPLPFVTPTGDLVFVFGGEFGGGRDRPLPTWEGLMVPHRLGLIRPGRAARGTICLALPYEITHGIPNTYDRSSSTVEGVIGRPVTVVKAEGLYVVAEYSKLDRRAKARAAPGFEPWEDRMWRATLGRAMITGKREGGLVYQVTDGIAVSRRVPVDIPLKDAALLFLADRPEALWVVEGNYYYADE